MARYAITSPDVTSAAKRLSQATGTTFEHRESSFWGNYCLVLGVFEEADVRFFQNLDPMYRPELDPQEDEQFESQFDRQTVLIDTPHAMESKIDAVLRCVFPDIVLAPRCS